MKQPATACQLNGSADNSSGSCTPSSAPTKLPIRIVPFHNPLLQNAVINASASSVPHLTYNGGPVISNAEVVVVFWGNNVSPLVTNGISDFYSTTLDSTYLDLLNEYSTVGSSYSGTTSNQKIGHGVVSGTYTIVPSNRATSIDDTAIQSELQAQIAAGHLPPITTDAQGQTNTLYTVYFPPGISITVGGSGSCVGGGFCAYHGTSKLISGAAFQYSVIPDFGMGSGCDSGCGNGSVFQNVTSVSSHELAEAITDAQVGFAGSGDGPPLAWYDDYNGEIGDICTGQQSTVSAHGKTYTIQLLFSNSQNNCVSGPSASLTLATTSSSVAAGTPLSFTITVKNSSGVILPFYTGTIHFTSSDPSAVLPNDTAFSSLDIGTKTFSATFNTPGAQSIHAVDADVPYINGLLNETVTQVIKRNVVITWPTPSPVTYRTPLSATQLNASSGGVPGVFVYSPAAGTILSAGNQTLSVGFTPTDTTTYNSATGSVSLRVTQATPSISWGTPAAIAYGTALSATQLNATSTTPGTFAYSPATGTVLAAGAQTLRVTLTPTDTANYSTATASVTLQVTQATPTISWGTPASIAYGTALSATQLNATSTTPGTFAYSPATGAVLAAGAQTLRVTLTPTDAANYSTATASVTLQVNQATPTISWASPAAVAYGTTLSATQLNATSTTSGTFAYSPAAGTVLAAGAQTLRVTLTPSDTANYSAATASVTLQVTQATPTISWASPAAVAYGTALSATQLNATSTTPGTFAYSPAAGTVLAAGAQTLRVTLTPSDTANYSAATASVTLQVTQATPTISWATPAAIAYGTVLSATQLNATSTTPGTFAYSPATGTVLAAGAQTLRVTLTPTDTANYSTATASVTLQVTQAVPSLTWGTPATINYPTPLSAAQLNASASVPGSFLYTPAAGTVLTPGLQTLRVTFTPGDIANYASRSASVVLQINQEPQTITLQPILTQVQGSTVTVNASASSGLPLTLLSLTPGVCSVTGTTIATPHPGICTIQATQPGNAIYSAAAPVSQSFTVVAAFTMIASPSNETVPRGGIAAFVVQLKAASGFSGAVTLSCSDGAPGSYCTDFPMTVRFNNGQAFAVSGGFFSRTTQPGIYSLTITGTSSSLVNSTSSAITVNVR